MKYLALFAAALACASAAALAQDTGAYAGIAAGTVKAGKFDNAKINDFLRGLGYQNPSTSSDTRDSGFRVFAGYKLNPSVAVEAFYAEAGSFGTRSSVTGGTTESTYEGKGYGLDLVLIAPFGDALSAYGRLGAMRVKVDASTSATGVIRLTGNQFSQNNSSAHFGIGLQYELTKAIALRAELERINKLGGSTTGGDYRADVFSLGALLRF